MTGHHTGSRIAGLCAGWLAGIGLQLQVPALRPLVAYELALLGGMLWLLAGWRWRRLWTLAVLGAALAGFGGAGWHATLRLRDALPSSLEGQDIVVTGVIDGLPQRGPSGVRFRFEVEDATVDGMAVAVPPLLVLGWYAGFHEDAVLSQPQLALGAGQRWRFGVKLKQPHGLLNPHGFDAELNLLEQGVRATGHVHDGVPPRLIDAAAAHPVERLRQRVKDAIEAAVADHRAAGVLSALAVGDQSAIDREDWDLFRNTGIAHLVSISGLHITMFAWLAGRAIGWAWRRHASAALWWPAPLAGRWGGLVAAWGYAVFSGWGVPSQRTVWMLAVVTLLQSTGKRWPWPLVLLVAAVVVSAVDPWGLLQAGFWLSFMAVGLLMASSPASRMQAPSQPSTTRGRVLNHLRGELRSQVIATLGLTPLTLVFFQQVSVVGFIANVVAIPLVTLVITPLAMLGVAASPLWLAGAWVVQQLCALLGWLSRWPGAVWTVPVAPWWALCAGLVGAALLVMPLPWRLRLLAVPMCMPLLMPSVVRPAEGQFELVAADVGQGTAVLVRTATHLLVYDTGPQYAPGVDAGQRVLVPLLHSRGEAKVDLLMLSHRDSDHVGGAASLIQSMPVAALRSSLEDTHPLLTTVAPQDRCIAGQRWTWDGVRFEVLHPSASFYDAHLKSNGMSCVLRVSGDSGTALLTGDVEREGEAWMLGANAALASDVLIVPHHGSKTSSTPALIDAVHPRFAVFQAGYRNHFGHPAPIVLARYEERGIAHVDSPSCGAWTWRSEMPGQGVCQRDADARYWHHGSNGARAHGVVEGACAVWPGFC